MILTVNTQKNQLVNLRVKVKRQLVIYIDTYTYIVVHIYIHIYIDTYTYIAVHHLSAAPLLPSLKVNLCSAYSSFKSKMNYLYQILLLNKSQLIAALLVLKVDGENSNFKKPNSDMFKLNLKI